MPHFGPMNSSRGNARVNADSIKFTPMISEGGGSSESLGQNHQYAANAMAPIMAKVPSNRLGQQGKVGFGASPSQNTSVKSQNTSVKGQATPFGVSPSQRKESQKEKVGVIMMKQPSDGGKKVQLMSRKELGKEKALGSEDLATQKKKALKGAMKPGRTSTAPVRQSTANRISFAPSAMPTRISTMGGGPPEEGGHGARATLIVPPVRASSAPRGPAGLRFTQTGPIGLPTRASTATRPSTAFAQAAYRPSAVSIPEDCSSYGTGSSDFSRASSQDTRSTAKFIDRVSYRSSPTDGSTQSDILQAYSTDCSTRSSSVQGPVTLQQRLQVAALNLIMDHRFEMFTGFVVLANFVCILIEVDASCLMTQVNKDTEAYKDAEARVNFMGIFNYVFISFFTLESAVRIFGQRVSYFYHNWNCFDFFIVVASWLGEIMAAISASMSGAESSTHLQILRSFRMLRLLRISRICISFHELYSLVYGLANCMRTLMWAAGLVILMLSMWSVIAVEYMHPLMAGLDAKGHYEECIWCKDAFKSIMAANLTLFQIITGDGWSLLARPLIDTHPWTAIILLSIIFTMVFGLVNLITAVVVESLAQARENDVIGMAYRKDQQREEAWTCFVNLVLAMDLDQNGELSLDELRYGLRDIPELGAYLTIMGIEEDDLRMTFDLLDVEGTQTVPCEDFAEALYKMKTQEVGTAVSFVKQQVENMGLQMELVLDGINRISQNTNHDDDSDKDDCKRKFEYSDDSDRETLAFQSVTSDDKNANDPPDKPKDMASLAKLRKSKTKELGLGRDTQDFEDGSDTIDNKMKGKRKTLMNQGLPTMAPKQEEKPPQKSRKSLAHGLSGEDKSAVKPMTKSSSKNDNEQAPERLSGGFKACDSILKAKKTDNEPDGKALPSDASTQQINSARETISRNNTDVELPKLKGVLKSKTIELPTPKEDPEAEEREGECV